jgi:hypothetical protein
VSSDLAALEPKVAAAAAQASSLQATLGQGSNQTAALRTEMDALRATIATLTANVQKLQASPANTTDLSAVTQKLAALAAADTRTAQQLAQLEAANQTVAQDIAALKSAPQQCFCGTELLAVNTTLATIKAAQAADAAAVSLANATVESLKSSVTTGAAAIASVNTILAALAATVANVSAIDLSVYAKTTDLANINAASLGGVPAAQYLRSRVVIYQAVSTNGVGDLSGRFGADLLCSTSTARPAGLVQVRAFLSTSASDQIADFPTKYGVPSGLPIESLSGAVLARNFTSLMGGSISMSLADAQVMSASRTWWSGSDANGKAVADTCQGFRDFSGSTNVGSSDSIDSAWIAFQSTSCGSPNAVLCIAH